MPNSTLLGRALAGLLSLTLLSPLASAQTLPPAALAALQPTGPGDQQWADGFGAPNVPGNVYAVAVAPNGDVYAGGFFTNAGGDSRADNIARWDGSSWHRLGPGLRGSVRAIKVMPNGDVVAGGDFDLVPGTTGTRRVARWNGTSWQGFGTGINGGTVNSLAIAPNGNLIVGGNYQDAGGNPNADRIAQWDGTSWQAYGSGITSFMGVVNALAVLSNGHIVAAGNFTDAGGNASADNIARWDGTAWQAYSPGLNSNVLALAVTPAGDLVAGGAFTRAGGTTATSYLARWDGSTWQPFGAGLNGSVASLTISGAGELVAGGDFLNAGSNPEADHIARWDGSTWRALGSSYPIRVLALATAPNGSILSGGQGTGGSTNPENLRRWTGTAWEMLADSQQHGFNFTVFAVAVANNGDYIAGGSFTNVYGDPAISYIARWDGSRWRPLGTGLRGKVNDIKVLPNGNLLVAGEFSNAGGTPGASYVARWDGTSWNAYGNGPLTFASAVAMDANGNVYAGGVTNNTGRDGYLTRWTGTTWQNISTSLGGPTLTAGGPVRALVAAPGGGVYVGGGFLGAGTTANTRFLARYDGTAWRSVGTLTNNLQQNIGVYALELAPNGDLLVGGSFSDAGGNTNADNIGRYTGSTWLALGTGARGTVNAIAAAPNGDVYAGGNFTGTNAQPYLEKVMRWNGTAWLEMGTGLNSTVEALAVSPGTGSVIVGGYFENVIDDSKASSFFAVFRPGFMTSTRDAADALTLQCYPNPAQGRATVVLPETASPQPLRLLDAMGRELRQLPNPTRASELTFDLKGLAPGLYLLRCGTATGRLVVQ